MRYSSPSILISAPEYLPNRIRSPALTSSATRSPVSSSLPLPTALTSACCGFSLAESGMMIPPTFCSPSSRRFTITRSCKGRKSMSLIIGQCHWRGDQLHEIVYSPQRRRNAEISAEKDGELGRMDRVEKPRLLFALCSRFIRLGGFFMKFRGRNAHPNRPGGLSYLGQLFT